MAQDIQILADPNSPKMDTSLIIYDNGEGQHPQDFPDTFLSLLRGNKNDIKFVQGKYNMGGAGAIVYCGEERYQLIASKRYDNTGNFGFTLVRMHPLTKEEEETKKNTFYEYFCPEEKIPEFSIDELDLNLYRRKFRTGTIIKLYSYDLPAGSRSVISRDLNQSLNEYLHNPALPMYIIDRKERYPRDTGLERIMYGLSNRLMDQKDKYIDRQFSLEITGNKEVGKIRATVTVFKVKNNEKSVKEFKDTIQNEFFKNNMSVAFSLNGQVHGSYSSEFITRALKYKLLKDYLLVHVDCTNTIPIICVIQMGQWIRIKRIHTKLCDNNIRFKFLYEWRDNLIECMGKELIVRRRRHRDIYRITITFAPACKDAPVTSLDQSKRPLKIGLSPGPMP